MFAKELRIGDRIGDRNPQRITALHELCSRREGPHVHVVTSGAGFCYAFDAPVMAQRGEVTA